MNQNNLLGFFGTGISKWKCDVHKRRLPRGESKSLYGRREEKCLWGEEGVLTSPYKCCIVNSPKVVGSRQFYFVPSKCKKKTFVRFSSNLQIRFTKAD
jgi:hypothetical protein